MNSSYQDEHETTCEKPVAINSPINRDTSNRYEKSAMWSKQQDVFIACDVALNELPPGYYVPDSNPSVGPFLRSRKLDTDDLILDLDQKTNYVISDIEKFLNSKKRYAELGFLWKRGYLLYGAPGTGKTSLVQSVAVEFIKRGGIVVFGEHIGDTSLCLAMIRKIEPNRPILLLLEEIEQIIHHQSEHTLLSILDGELQVDNIITIATTNYPEQLDARVINRPSRFDIIQHIGYPSYESRLRYLQHKVPEGAIPDTTLELWAKSTENMGYSHLKEVIVACLIMEKPFEDVLTRLQQMSKGKFSSGDDKTSSIGFTG